MSKIMTRLEELRDVLAAIPSVSTCKVGLEHGISPGDYPLIRIVPSVVTDGPTISRKQCDVWIYFGAEAKEVDAEADADGRVGLEKVYAALFDLEGLIRDAVHANGGICRDTVTDEDRLSAYKLMAIKAVVEG